MAHLHVLNRPVTTARAAAAQLRIPATTLLWWLEGGTRGDTTYEPILRPVSTGTSEMTWGEVVEARYLRAYRQEGVSLQQLRPFVSRLRAEFNVPYPLAHFKPYMSSNRKLLVELQQDAQLPADLSIFYEVANGQIIINPLIGAFLSRIDFSEDESQEAERIYPLGKKSPVVLDPLISSAAATVNGIRTEVIAEQMDAGATVEEIADDFDLPVESVRAALAYEWDGEAA